MLHLIGKKKWSAERRCQVYFKSSRIKLPGCKIWQLDIRNEIWLTFFVVVSKIIRTGIIKTEIGSCGNVFDRRNFGKTTFNYRNIVFWSHEGFSIYIYISSGSKCIYIEVKPDRNIYDIVRQICKTWSASRLLHVHEVLFINKG